jgi:hypothetical protein
MKNILLFVTAAMASAAFGATPDEALGLADMTRTNTQRIAVQQAIIALSGESSDSDHDGYIEAPAMSTGSGGPTGGGVIPATSAAPATDSYGVKLGYCAWDNGSTNSSSGRITGVVSGYTAPVIAVISAGLDNVFNTTCANISAGQGAQGDDYVVVYNSTQIQQGNSGTLYFGDPVVDLPTLNGLAAASLTDGQLRLVKSNNALYRWNASGSAWVALAGAGLPWNAGAGTGASQTYYSSNPIAIGTTTALNQLTVVDPGTGIPIGVKTQGQFNGVQLCNPTSGTDGFVGYDNTNNVLVLNAQRSGGQIAFQINGTSYLTISNTGVVNAPSLTSANAVISGGSINGTPIGAIVASTGAFTTITSSGLATLNSLITANATINGGAINGTTIGASTPASGAFTTLSTTGAATLNSLVTANATISGGSINGTPIGASVASTGSFSSLTAASLFVGAPTLTTNANDSVTLAQFRYMDPGSGSGTNANQLYIKGVRYAAGNTYATSSTILQEVVDSTSMGYMQFNPPSGPAGLAWGSGSKELLRLTASGSLGIGTASPQRQLHVYGLNTGGNTVAQVENPDTTGGGGSGLYMVANGHYGYLTKSGSAASVPNAVTMSNGDSAPLTFVVNNTTEVGRFAANGFAGLGTASPQAQLHVKASGSPESMRLETNTAAGTGSNYLSYYDASGRKGWIGYGSSTTDEVYLANERNANTHIYNPNTPGGVEATFEPAGNMVAHAAVVTNAGQQQLGIYTYNISTVSGAQYIHLKTNQHVQSGVMYMLEAKGYDYGNATAVDVMWSGYLYAASSGIYSEGESNVVSGSATASNQYISSDGYLVVVMYSPNCYYLGFVVNAYTANPTGIGTRISIVASTNSAASSGIF